LPPLKVLTYLHSFEPGGVERDILRFNKAWREAGLDATIVLGRREGVLAVEAPELPYVVLSEGGGLAHAAESVWMILKLPGVIRRLRPDVLFCAGNSYSVVAVAMRLLLGRRCPPIVYRVSNDLMRRDLPAPLRLAHRLWQIVQAPAFDLIVAMAEPARDQIIDQMNVDARRVVTIDNASMLNADVTRLASARSTEPRQHPGRRYLAVGRLASQKNFELLIDAFARIATADDRLTIVGEGPRRAAIVRRAERHGVADRIDMPGHLHDLDGHFARADALVLSSDYEGLGIVVIEALAAGLPVVATDCGPNMKFLLDGVGRLVPVRDADALAAAMVAVLSDPADVGAMRARARMFTVEATVDEWLGAFGRVARVSGFRGRNDTAIAPR